MADERLDSDLAVRLTNVDLNLLPALVVLLQEQSVTRAAARLGLSQPAMSHSLSRLRTLLRDDLLVRHGNGSTRTPRGRLLLERTPSVLGSVSEQVLHVPEFDPARDERRFTLAMTTSTAFGLSPLLLRISRERAPGVTFRIVEAAVPGADIFEAPELDLAVIADTVATGYPRTTLYLDRWVGVVDRGNPAVDDALTMQHLATLGHVAYESPSLRLQPYIALAAAGVVPRRELVSANFLMIPMLVSGTDSIAIVQERLATRLVPHFPLRILDLPLAVPPLGLDAVRNPRSSGDAATTWLETELRRQLAFVS